jgi:serine/threonine protein kinase
MTFVRQPNAEPIPGYRLIEPLGSGGFGEAWKCEAPGGLFKAIKFVFGNLNSLDVDGARAEQELKSLNRVKEVRHPFVLSMDRIEVVGGELVIVMELADKNLHESFEECIQAGLVGIPRDTLFRYMRDAAEALDHMNEKHGLQHLDIKPRNLFLVSDRVKVADFGLVKHLERSGASGLLGAVTPLYAAPETFTNDISERSDQYSLAIVYQELLTGQRPFNGKNARQLAHQHLNEPPELRALPEGDRPIVARALEKDPAKRFPNCLAFVRALYQARAHSHASLVDANGNRPKTIADTLENFQLEQGAPENGLVPVDLGPDVDIDRLAGGSSVSHLGMTIAQPQTGALRPTVVIGVGAFGRRALVELRCRFLDRFGDLEKIPLVRFLYIDTDLDAIKAAHRGAPELAFDASETYHLPLQHISHYRRRQLDQLNEWLPREKLYSVPRSLKTQGSRALGRLAFTDNYMRLITRLKREVQQASHPDAIYATVSQTGLALRDNVPRVYVLAAAAGGASGYLTDLGYATRRLLKQMHNPEAPVSLLLFCGAPDDPATPRLEQANLYATLTELNHFADPAVPFSAQYGTDGPRLTDEGPAFDQTYLLTQPHRTPECRRDALVHLGSYLFHELTTPLGLRLDQSRLKHHLSSPFRSLGTFGVWFPRGLLLRLAARGTCQTILQEWQSGGAVAGASPPPLTGPEQSLVEAALARVLTEPELLPDALATRLADLAGAHLDGPPRDVLTRLLLTVEEQSQQLVAQEDPGAWARQALTRVRDWLGGGLPMPGTAAVQQRRSPLTRALEGAAAALAEEWDGRFNATVAGLMEYPGRRVAVAEAAEARLIRFCDEAATALQARLQQQTSRSAQGQEQLEGALENCLSGGGGWSWFGSRSRRALRVFVDHLAAFARQCLTEDTSVAVLHFFAALRGRLSDRLRDLTFCRQRLRHVEEALQQPDGLNEWEAETVADTMTFTRTPNAPGLSSYGPGGPTSPLTPTPLASADSFWESIRASATTRVVLPDGEPDLEKAARRFLATLTAEQWTQLDQAFTDHVLVLRGGLQRACLDTADLLRHLMVPLLSQAIATLSDHLPITDVAQAEFSTGGDEAAIDAHIGEYHASAEPLVAKTVAAAPHTQKGQGSGVRKAVFAGGGGGDGPDEPRGKKTGQVPRVGARKPVEQHSFLLIPASDAGKAFGEAAQRVVPELHLVNVPGQADLMFCREQTGLGAQDIERVLHACRNAYHELSTLPQASPHARFDIQDWTPLDP